VPPPPSARGLALRILRQLDRREGFSNRVLAEHLLAWSGDLARRDRGLVTTLVYGVLRHRARLDAHVDAVAERPDRLSGRVRELLRLAVFELRELARPLHVAASQAQALRQEFDPQGALRGLVQAVLAGVDRDGAALDERLAAGKPLDVLALRWSVPRWLAGRMLKQLGPERALARARALAQPPPVDLRVDRTRTTAEAVAAALREADPRADVALVGQPQALRVRGGGELAAHPWHLDGRFSVQGLGAQQAALSLGPCPEEHVLDACCGLGTKTLQLAELMQRRGELCAVDLSAERLAAHDDLVHRGGLDVPGLTLRRVRGDLTADLPDVDDRRWDAVLLDAPCTGLGNLARHPELRWTARFEDIAACAALQRALLDRCLARVRPGGRLVYAVCSLEPEEGPDVARAAATASGATLEHEAWWTPEHDGGDGFYHARLRP
jgi:16S rRNA (cytosine967-C5)-methyltransferase